MVAEGKRRMVHDDELNEIKKGPWKAEEDEVLINHVKKYGPRDWSSIRSKGLLQRTGKSCRLRWVNKLRPNLKNGVKFSAEEERTMIELQAQFGNKWAKIATHLSGRTDNDVKNFWSSRQKRLTRILQTSAPSSSKPQKNNTKEIEAPSFYAIRLEAPSFSSSTEEELASKTKSCSPSHIINSQTIKMGMPELMHQSMVSQQHSLTPEAKPFIDLNLHLPFPSTPQIQRDFPPQLESQDFISRLEDPGFLDAFGSWNGSALGTAPLLTEASYFRADAFGSRDFVAPDVFTDDYPPIDIFDPIEPLPSPSDWSSMD